MEHQQGGYAGGIPYGHYDPYRGGAAVMGQPIISGASAYPPNQGQGMGAMAMGGTPGYGTIALPPPAPYSEEVRYRTLWQEVSAELRLVKQQSAEALAKKDKTWSQSVETLTATYKSELAGKEKEYALMTNALENKFLLLKSALKTAKTRIASLRRERDDARTSHAELESRLSLAEGAERTESDRNRDLAEQVNKLRRLHGEQLARATEYEHQVRELRRELDSKDRESARVNEVTTFRLGERESELAREREQAQVAIRTKEDELRKAREQLQQQQQQITELHHAVRNTTDLVSSQKRTVDEATAKGASFSEQMDTLRKDNAYLRRYQDQQREVVTKLRTDNDKLAAKVAALKLRAVAALDLEEEARDKLKESEEKQTGVEKKLIRLETELRVKHPLTYVPLCRQCRTLRNKCDAQQDKILHLRRKCAALEQTLAERARRCNC